MEKEQGVGYPSRSDGREGSTIKSIAQKLSGEKKIPYLSIKYLTEDEKRTVVGSNDQDLIDRYARTITEKIIGHKKQRQDFREWWLIKKHQERQSFKKIYHAQIRRELMFGRAIEAEEYEDVMIEALGHEAYQSAMAQLLLREYQSHGTSLSS